MASVRTATTVRFTWVSSCEVIALPEEKPTFIDGLLSDIQEDEKKVK